MIATTAQLLGTWEGGLLSITETFKIRVIHLIVLFSSANSFL